MHYRFFKVFKNGLENLSLELNKPNLTITKLIGGSTMKFSKLTAVFAAALLVVSVLLGQAKCQSQ